MRPKLGVVALLALLAFPANAAEHRLDVTFWGSFVAPTGSNVVNEASNVKLDFHAGGGVGLSATCHFTDALRLELGGAFWRSHGELRLANTAAADLGHLHAFPIFGLLQYHLVSGPVTPYVGVGAAYVILENLHSGDLDTLGSGVVTLDNKVAFVAQIGASANVFSTTSIVLDARYIPLSSDSTAASGGTFGLRLNPLVVSMGLRAAF